MLVKSKVRISLGSKQFLSWTWFYQGTTKISFLWSSGTQKKVAFLGLAFKWLLLNYVKSLLAAICNSEITVLVSEAQAYGTVSVRPFTFVQHINQIYIKK